MAFVDEGDPSGAYIVIGPPEGIVDALELPEPFATRLHNILFNRGLLTYEDVVRNPKQLNGALQEVISLDVQKLQEAYFKYSEPAGGPT